MRGDGMAEMGLAEGIDLLARRAKIVKALLAAGLLSLIAMLIGEIAELHGLINLDNADLDNAEGLYAAVLLANWLILILTYVVFGTWIYRAAANVDAASVPGFRFTPGWAVGWHFVPIANLFKPFGAMRQIWNASHGNETGDLDRGNALLTLWWTCWIVTSIVANYVFRLSLKADTAEEFRTVLELEIFSSAISLALYPLAYQLVDRTTRAQQERLTSAHIFA